MQSVGEDIGKQIHLFIAGGNMAKRHTNLPFNTAIPLVEIYPKVIPPII